MIIKIKREVLGLLRSKESLALIAAGLIYASISLVNHYCFRTHAYDLGLQTQAAYDYRHFRWNANTVLQPHPKNLLADHFELIHLPIAQLTWLGGAWMLLIVQIAVILLGAWGVRQLVRWLWRDDDLAFWALIHILGMWGIFAAVAFDYHNSVIGAMLVPWFVYKLIQRQWIAAALFFALILASKEVFALWMIVFCMALGFHALLTRKRAPLIPPQILYFGLVAVVYFGLVMAWIRPALNPNYASYPHFNYSILGQTPTEAARNALAMPLCTLKYFFVSHTPDLPHAKGIKLELHIVALLSGAWVLCFRPQFLVLLLPVYAQKLFNDDPQKWGLNYHYSIEYAPALSLALFTWPSITKWWAKRKRLLIVLSLMPILVTLVTLDPGARRSIWYTGKKAAPFRPDHWQPELNRADVFRLSAHIPPDAPLSASPDLVPRLAERKAIYCFPQISDAKYVFVIKKETSVYPATKDQYNSMLSNLMQNTHWKIVEQTNELILFKSLD